MKNFNISHADYASIRNLIQKNGKNSYLREINRGPETNDNPLPFLNVRPKCHYVVATDEEGVIVGAATLYFQRAGEPNFIDEAKIATSSDRIFLSQLSVHPCHRKRGIARSILDSVFSLAANETLLISFGGFENDGKEALCPILPSIHKRFSQVSAIYYGADSKISGTESYVLKPNESGVFIPFLK